MAEIKELEGEISIWKNISLQCYKKYEKLVDYLNIEKDSINLIYCIHKRLGHVLKNEIL